MASSARVAKRRKFQNTRFPGKIKIQKGLGFDLSDWRHRSLSFRHLAENLMIFIFPFFTSTLMLHFAHFRAPCENWRGSRAWKFSLWKRRGQKRRLMVDVMPGSLKCDLNRNRQKIGKMWLLDQKAFSSFSVHVKHTTLLLLKLEIWHFNIHDPYFKLGLYDVTNMV